MLSVKNIFGISHFYILNVSLKFLNAALCYIISFFVLRLVRSSTRTIIKITRSKPRPLKIHVSKAIYSPKFTGLARVQNLHWTQGFN